MNFHVAIHIWMHTYLDIKLSLKAKIFVKNLELEVVVLKYFLLIGGFSKTWY